MQTRSSHGRKQLKKIIFETLCRLWGKQVGKRGRRVIVPPVTKCQKRNDAKAEERVSMNMAVLAHAARIAEQQQRMMMLASKKM